MTRRAPAQRGGRIAGVQSQQQQATPLKRGPWTVEEDELLTRFVEREGEGRWRTLPRRAGLLRCGKSCRLRWMNYLRPDIKRGPIADDEEDLILRLHRLLGNRWSLIAGRLPGRTDNEIKNYWNSHLSKKLVAQGFDPRTHTPLAATAAAAADNAPPPPPPPPVEAPLPPPPPVQPPTSPAAGTGGDGLASPADGGDDFAAATMSLDAQGFEGFGDQFCAGHGGFEGDMCCAMVDADDAFTSYVDSLINEGPFVDYFVEGGSDHKNANSEKDEGGAI